MAVAVSESTLPKTVRLVKVWEGAQRNLKLAVRLARNLLGEWESCPRRAQLIST